MSFNPLGGAVLRNPLLASLVITPPGPESTTPGTASLLPSLWRPDQLIPSDVILSDRQVEPQTSSATSTAVSNPPTE